MLQAVVNVSADIKIREFKDDLKSKRDSYGLSHFILDFGDAIGVMMPKMRGKVKDFELNRLSIGMSSAIAQAVRFCQYSPGIIWTAAPCVTALGFDQKEDEDRCFTAFKPLGLYENAFFAAVVAEPKMRFKRLKFRENLRLVKTNEEKRQLLQQPGIKIHESNHESIDGLISYLANTGAPPIMAWHVSMKLDQLMYDHRTKLHFDEDDFKRYGRYTFLRDQQFRVRSLIENFYPFILGEVFNVPGDRAFIGLNTEQAEVNLYKTVHDRFNFFKWLYKNNMLPKFVKT